MTDFANNDLNLLNEFSSVAPVMASESGAASPTRSIPKADRPRKALAPFSIRLTQEERERLEAEAKGKPLGVYIREKLFADAASPRKARRKPAPDQALLAKVLGMLGQSRLANNMNQIAKAAHIGVIILTPALIEDIEQACRDIRIMRDALLAALGFPPASGGGP